VAFEVRMPRLGWAMESGALVEWHRAVGEYVRAGEILLSVQGDKAIQDIEAVDSGVLQVPPGLPGIGEEVPVGALLGYLVPPGELDAFRARLAHGEPRQAARVAASAATGPRTEGRRTLEPAAMGKPAIAPRARRLAAELGVDWEHVVGTGPQGRITPEDIEHAARDRARPADRAPERMAVPTAPPSAESPTAQAAQPAEAQARAITAPGHWAAVSAQTVAAVTLTTDADATDLVALKDRLNAALAGRQQAELSCLHMLVRIVSRALVQHGELNARLEGEKILRRSSVHIGIEVDTDQGPMVPVIRDAASKTLGQIAREATALADKAWHGLLDPDDVADGTFTLCDLGVYGMDAFTPIIRLPQCAILGLGRIRATPALGNTARPGMIVRQRMYLSLTFDHRVVDGAPAARFLAQVKQMIEEPWLWWAA